MISAVPSAPAEGEPDGGQATEPAVFCHAVEDGHRPAVDLWIDPLSSRPVAAVLDTVAAGDEYVLAVQQRSDLARLARAPRVGITYWQDRKLVARRGLQPVWTSSFELDERTAQVRVRFAPCEAAMLTYPLDAPIEARLTQGPVSRRDVALHLVALGPYEGVVSVSDRGARALIGAVLRLAVRLNVSRELVLCVQIIARHTEPGQYRCRMVDARSVRSAGVLLALRSRSLPFEGFRALGVSPSKLNRLISTRTVQDADMMSRALSVRLVGNQFYGRLPGLDDPQALQDDLDGHAVTFVCLLGQCPIGTGRVVINNGDRSLSEIERQVGLPDEIWRGRFVEVSRVAIHPDYRGTGVMVAIFREFARIALNQRCRYLVLDCIEKLVPVYTKIGARKLPGTKRHPYSNETVYVMCLDIVEVLSTLRGNPMHWFFLFGPPVGEAWETTSLARYREEVHGSRALIYHLKIGVSRLLHVVGSSWPA